MLHTKKKKLTPNKFLALILGIIAFTLFLWEEHKPYEILHSTIMSSPNLTETRLTIVVHSLLPINDEALAAEIIEHHQRLNGGHPNPYFELELYRTQFHYRMQILYDTLLCNGDGQIVTEIELQE